MDLIKLVQLTILSIKKYGPWTHTLGVDREHILQMYQSALFGTSQSLFSKRNGLVFQARSDQLYAISNKMSIQDHIQIHKSLTSKFSFPLEMSIGFDKSPFRANEIAFDSSRHCAICNHKDISGMVQRDNELVYLIHIDVKGLTRIEGKMSYFESYAMIQTIHQKLVEFFQQRNSLGFYMGGDNFMIISDELAKQHATEFVSYANDVLGISVNCGIGIESTGRKAAMNATASLDMIRAHRNTKEKYEHVFSIQDNCTILNRL